MLTIEVERIHQGKNDRFRGTLTLEISRRKQPQHNTAGPYAKGQIFHLLDTPIEEDKNYIQRNHFWGEVY